MNSNFLERAGLRPYIAAQIDEKEKEASIVRISHVHRDVYTGINYIGDEISLKLTGNLLNSLTEQEFPVVGDFAIVDENPMASFSRITRVLKRENEISRTNSKGVQVLASNIDVGIICMSLNQNFNSNRALRFISLLKASHVEPILFLTKLDLYNGEKTIEDLMDDLKKELKVEKIYALSLEKKISLHALEKVFRDNKTFTLLGSSGVGKSTLTNFLVGTDIQKIQDIRNEDGKGRHTTVSRSLHIIPGGVIIDTPGMRGLMLAAGSDEIDESFSDIHELSTLCRFTNCSHSSGPDCAIVSALEDRELDEKRYQSYLKLQREAAFLERKANHSLYLEQKKKWKKLNMQYRKSQR